MRAEEFPITRDEFVVPPHIGAIASEALTQEQPPAEPIGQVRKLGSFLARNFLKRKDPVAATNEAKLTSSFAFEEVVGHTSFHETAVIAAGRKIPKSLDEFSFVPLTYRTPRPGNSLASGFDQAHIPDGIKTTYDGKLGRKPWLDTRFAIGIARNDWLVAVGGAGVDTDGALKITQLQDVSGTSGADRKARFKTGLHDGFLWRDTLVTAWGAVAMGLAIGDHLTIQSGDNNPWRKLSKHPFPQYDETAQRMGFMQLPNGNWQKGLPKLY